MADARERAQLRAILRLLLAERDDAQLLYIPRGEAGMRRMIAALLACRTPSARDAELAALLAALPSPLSPLDAQRVADERACRQRADAPLHEPAVDEQ